MSIVLRPPVGRVGRRPQIELLHWHDPTAQVECGGEGGDISSGDHIDGRDATCFGGGGGGGSTQSNRDTGGSGGDGLYGGGGGGGAVGGDGGDGGFGGGGGAGWEGLLFSNSGGDGGFGGGGGAGDGDSSGRGGVYDGSSGFYGGAGGQNGGGGGAALGGAIFSDEGTVVVRNSTFTGNFVTRGVGGNAGLSGGGTNGSDTGGAIFNLNGHLTVHHSTISGNAATATGGGIVVLQTPSSPPTSFNLLNTILANNGATACLVQGVVIATSFTGNLIEDNFNCGTPASSEDPQLGSLQNNQGPTPTMALSGNSPALDIADSAVGLGRDQRGQERPIGAGFDIGAFERCEDPIFGPCIITGGIGTITTVPLTIAVSPEGTGTTTPAPGTHEVNLNSVIALTATPNTSHRFVGWTGDPVGDPSSPSTFIGMDDEKSITANFEVFDFNFSAVAPFAIVVGGSGSTTVTVNSMGAFSDPVALSVTGQPSDSSASFDPTPVDPAAGGSASSELNVSLGPAALPGLYTLNVVGTSPTLEHSTAVSLSVVATPESVIEVIGTLQELGCIDSEGVSNAFTTKLAEAQAMIAAGDTQTAINILTALLRQLQAQAGKHITASCTHNGQVFDPAAVLIAQVQSLLASLGGGARANPVIGNVVGSGNLEVSGAAVSLLNPSKQVIATTMTDVTGFYFFPRTRDLAPRANYTVKVTSMPAPYKKSSPAVQTFTWRVTAITLGNFVLN